MKNRTLFLLIIFFIFSTGAMSGQIGLLKRAIDNKIGQKADSAAKNNAKQADQPGGTKATGRGLFGGKIDIKYDDVYNFTGRIYTQMEAYDKKETVKSDYFTYFNPGTQSAGIEVRVAEPREKDNNLPTVFVFDGTNRSLMILMDNGDSKTGIISEIPSDSAITAQANKQKDEIPPTVTRTGNSKTIAGYKCDEYKVVEANKEGYSLVWMTKEINLKADRRYWQKAGMPAYYGHPEFQGSVMLALEAYDKDNKLAMKMETKEINEKFDHSISTAGYTFMKMNFGQAGKK